MTDHLGYLFAAYTIIFVVIFLYVMFIWRRQKSLEAELHAVESRLAELSARTAPRPSDPAPQK
jgi:CcmD family protein